MVGEELKQTVEIDPLLEFSKDKVAGLSYQLCMMIASLNAAAQVR